jgi:hypothetical protein
MKVLSFDIGIVNMAYCIIEDTTKEILHWEVFSLCNSTEIENCKDLVIKLDQRPHILKDIGAILLERQPKCNPKMRAMASALRSYLVIRGMVDLKQKFVLKDYSPKHKLMCWDGPVPKFTIKSEYGRRKKLAIFQCEKLIQGQDTLIKEIYNNAQSKKDDLSDCYLQGLSYIMFRDKDKDKPVTKRKPSALQTKYSKFSKSNIKFLIEEFLGKFTTHPTDSQVGLLDMTDVLKLFFGRNPKVDKLVKGMYGTKDDQFREELISPMWDNLQFSTILLTTPPVKQKKIKEVQEEVESNSD